MAAEAQKTFAGYDTNADGRLASAEYAGAGGLRSAMGGFVQQHAKEIDADGDGGITRDALLAVALRMFDKADQNRDARLSGDELTAPATPPPPAR